MEVYGRVHQFGRRRPAYHDPYRRDVQIYAVQDKSVADLLDGSKPWLKKLHDQLQQLTGGHIGFSCLRTGCVIYNPQQTHKIWLTHKPHHRPVGMDRKSCRDTLWTRRL